jgi:hypothetical protein
LCYDEVEKRGEGTSLSHTSLDWEGLGSASIDKDGRLRTLKENLDHVDEMLMHPQLGHCSK